MIIVKISDGLGNQLFQYAFGRKLALLRNISIKLDLSWFKTNNAREYKLRQFNIVENFASDKELKKIKKYQKKNGKKYFLHNYFNSDSSIYIKQKQFPFDIDMLNAKKYAYLDGYWQTPKYFNGIENILREEFTLKDEPSIQYKQIDSQIKASSSISLHVRRSDYLTLKRISEIFGTCPPNYYHKAIQEMAKNNKNPTFFIFSDDIGWVRENIQINYPTVFVSNGKLKDYEELILMSKCEHNIIANSTFSWWGAWLNNNPNKVVIAPKKWFKETSKSAKDLIPESWMKL